MSGTTGDPEPSGNEQGLDFVRKAGIAGVAGSVAYLITGLVINLGGAVEEPDNAADMGRYLAEVADAEASYLTYGIAGVALCLLFIPMSLAVPRLMERRSDARLGTIAVVAGLGVLLPAYVLSVASTTGLSNAADNMDAGRDALFAVFEFSSSMSTVFFAAGSLLTLGLGPLLWGVAARRTDGFPAWLSGLLVAVGVTGLVWAVFYVTSPVILILVLLNVLGSLVAYAALSVHLVRAGRLDE